MPAHKAQPRSRQIKAILSRVPTHEPRGASTITCFRLPSHVRELLDQFCLHHRVNVTDILREFVIDMLKAEGYLA